MDVAINHETGAEPRPGTEPRPGKLPVQVVEHLHRLLGGDARVEGMVEIYIGHRWQAKTLLHLPAHVAKEIIRRPADFLTAVKKHCEPELKF